MTAQRIGTDLARGAASDIGFAWSLCLGIGFIVMGLVGFVPSPLVGVPTAAWGTPLFVTGDAHNVLNLVAGAVLLYAALGLTGARRGALLMGIGGLGLGAFVVGLVSGTAFGLLSYPVNLLDQLVSLVAGSVSIMIGYLARGGTIGRGHRDDPAGTDPAGTDPAGNDLAGTDLAGNDEAPADA